jgi:hypothetical protein
MYQNDSWHVEVTYEIFELCRQIIEKTSINSISVGYK